MSSTTLVDSRDEKKGDVSLGHQTRNTSLEQLASQENVTTPGTKNESDGSIDAEEKVEGQYLSGLKLGLVMLGLCLAVLLVGLVSNLKAVAEFEWWLMFDIG